MSPREHAAKMDLLRVQDCLWARMKPSEISRALGKDKAWVSRAIRKVQDGNSTAYQSPKERQIIGENLAQLDSLLSKALAITERGTVTEKLAAVRVALSVIQQRTNYEFSVGLVQQRAEQKTGENDFVTALREHIPSEDAISAIAQRRLVRRRQEEQRARSVASTS